MSIKINRAMREYCELLVMYRDRTVKVQSAGGRHKRRRFKRKKRAMRPLKTDRGDRFQLPLLGLDEAIADASEPK